MTRILPPLIASLLALATVPAAAISQVGTTPAIAGVVAAGTPVELIQEGFKGTEGPITAQDGSLLFTETQDNRITRIAADGSVQPFLDATNGSNGLAWSRQGELYSVQVADTKVGVIYPRDKARVLADQFEGLRFGRPNDLVLDQQGNVYFTDSGANVRPGEPAPPPAAKPAVYRISAKGQLTRVAADIERPNGIQLSPDEKTLYVANTLGEHVLAYELRADGSLGPRRNFAKLAGWRKTDTGSYSSGADGLAVDAAGRLYVASSAGIEVFSPQGEALGVIALPKPPQNLAFAGTDKHTLYVVGRGAAYRIALQAQGFGGRAK